MAYSFSCDSYLNYSNDVAWQGEQAWPDDSYTCSGLDTLNVMSDTTLPQSVSSHVFSRIYAWNTDTLSTNLDAMTSSIPSNSLPVYESPMQNVNILENFYFTDHDSAEDQYAYQCSEESQSPSSEFKGHGSPSQSRPSASALARRRSQNRNAQRAFRARRREQVENITKQFTELTYRYNQLEKDYADLEARHKALISPFKSSNEHNESDDNTNDSKPDAAREKSQPVSPGDKSVESLPSSLSLS
ncbi:hypothetical protein F5884DRAFT_546937 [Xylogone sp. PMI_703]|nr:hypothetical protein F5884DRAFT_546937 [Xylogone sp. PMI_703]